MVTVLVLAAGQGKRMHSKVPKVLHPLLGKPLVSYVIETALSLEPRNVVGVVSPAVLRVVSEWEFEGPVSWVVQNPPRGTADAVRCGLSEVSSETEDVMILPGDVPLVRWETLKALMQGFEASRGALALLGAEVADPHGYGRIMTDVSGEVVRIVEELDASETEQAIKMINTGIMLVKRKALAEVLKDVTSDNAQGEFYLTDLVALFRKRGLGVKLVSCEESGEVLGINDRHQLAEAQKRLLRRLVRKWQVEGVTFTDPERVYLEQGVTFGQDTVVEPGVVLRGDVRIGEGCHIGVGSVIEDSRLENDVEIKPYSVVEKSVVRSHAVIGPFAHLRPESDIGEGAKVGNFVEVKKSRLAPGVKASHLTYLGDTTVGEGTNIGAGTITCNYDGKRKHPTTIGKGVFVGSNTALVAPVTVGDGAIIAAGSVITKEVPPHTLGVGRARQQNIYKWKKFKKET